MKPDRSHSQSAKLPGAFIEKPEPTTRQSPVPMALIILMGFILFWGGMYVDRFGGQFNPDVFTPYKSVKQLEGYVPKSGLFGKGQQIYGTVCNSCHGPGGLGAPGQFPPLAGSEWVLAAGIDRLVRIIEHGLSGPIEVKGQQWNASMPAMGPAISSDEDLAALLTFIRTNKAWGNNASEVTPEQVQEIRPKLGNRSQPWTAPELLNVPLSAPPQE